MTNQFHQVSLALENFCNEFRANPYLHRNEHSIHLQIAQWIADTPDLLENPITHLAFNTRNGSRKIWSVNRIQKEWPTKCSIPTRDNRNRTYKRGHFDLAILPFFPLDQPLLLDNWQKYYDGYAPLPEAIFEVGLDYKAHDHLEPDIIKFRDSGNKCHAFFIHLYREFLSDSSNEYQRIHEIFERRNVASLFKPILSQDDENRSASSAFVGYRSQTLVNDL